MTLINLIFIISYENRISVLIIVLKPFDKIPHFEF
jgi:hypothetical protein